MERDQARLIAERVARRVSGGDTGSSTRSTSRGSLKNGAPVEDLAAIRTALHELERKLERVESKLTGGTSERAGQPRARFKDFVSSSPPSAMPPSIASEPTTSSASWETIISPASESPTEKRQFTPPTQSPWLSSFSAMMTSPVHPSGEPLRAQEIPPLENPQSSIRNPQSAAHPSQERFGVEEATVSELVDFFESEKKCALEPGKPCDHCAMCTSRGF